MINAVDYWRESKNTFRILGLKGKVISFTKVYSPTKSMNRVSPYFIAICKLENNFSYTFQVVNTENLKIGDKVKTVLRRSNKPRKSGIVYYQIKLERIK